MNQKSLRSALIGLQHLCASLLIQALRELDCLSELDNESIQLKVDLRDRIVRFRQRWELKFKDYAILMATPDSEKREWISQRATIIPGKASRTAEFLVNICAQCLKAY